MGVYQLIYEQIIPASLESVWEFIATPKNLQRITPPHMKFIIRWDSLPDVMYPGLMIYYTVYPFPFFPSDWLTEITHVEPMKYFVDEQRKGPYTIWHHEHILEPIENGTRMKDIITYQPPFGFLGDFANSLFIEKKIKEIFNYRFEAINTIFGTMN